MDIEEALNEFRAEYESSEHWGSDLIISLECAEVISAELDKKDKIINLMAEIIEECRQNDCLESDEIDLSEIAGKDRIIDYFTNKVEEDKDNG